MKQPIKMTPGDDLHLSLLMAPHSLNLAVGQLRDQLLGYGRAAFEAGKAGQCLHQIQEPPTKAEALAHYSQQAILAMGAPAVVAVPDELIRTAKQALACMDGLQQHLGRAVCQVEADALRAALAATPADHVADAGKMVAAASRTTGYVAPKGRYVPPVLFSPYTGEPRDARDIASDPQGVLIVPSGALLTASSKPAAETVVLPEPFTTLVRKTSWSSDCYEASPRSNAQEYGRQWADERINVYTEQQVRALLAGVSAPAAMAVEPLDIVQAAADAASVGHLSHLIDHQSQILARAMAAMKAVELTASPIDEPHGDLDARIPYEAWATFVDARAALLHDVAQSPVAAPQAQADCLTCNDHGAVGNILTVEPCPDCTVPAIKAQADARDAEQERWMEIGKAIERACIDQPESTEIVISLERDAGTVTMFDPDGNEHVQFSHEDGLAGVVNEAIDAAIAAAKGEQ